MGWQTPVVGILLVIQFAIGQLLGAPADSGIALAAIWKVVILPAALVGLGYALNQLKPVGTSARFTKGKED